VSTSPEDTVLFRQMFEAETATYTYLLADEQTKEAVLIDPVRETVDRDVQVLEELGLKLVHVLETHVHADHVTSAGLLRERFGARTVVGRDGGAPCADVLAGDGDVLRFGRHRLEARSTPGHTNGCISYVEPEAKLAFTGDTLLIRGCGRTDFQQGDARKLYRSVHEKLFTLDDDTKVYPGHDYKGRTMSTIGEEKRFNPRLGGGRTEDDFVAIMTNLKLAYPKKIDEAVPANLKCGLPEGRVVQDARDVVWAPMQRTAAGVPEVAAGWVKESLPKGDYRVIDVREADERAGELRSIPGSEHVPLATLALASRGWDKKSHYVVVCRSGGRSGRAALELESLGFHNVASMAGGMLGWDGPRS
jgi:glyoxylase-like metal-dependent hydrolase (beta-lactamase superfamily II)/rhodanese-related sulfurtransferase